MSPGGTAFVRRALLFLDAARARRYPNARWLAEKEEISLPTARRVLYRLRDDYGAPLRYVELHRGWELTEPYTFPAGDLATRRELLAVALALEVGAAVADPELEGLLETFRLRLAARLDTSDVGIDELLVSFSTDRTDRSVLADPRVIDVIEAVARRRVIRFRYASPWRDDPPRERRVEPLHVRCIDGAAYLLARTAPAPAAAEERIFNLAFVEALELEEATFDPLPDTVDRDWSATFGIWSDPAQARDVTARIGPPGARYFAGQTWHADQQDRWEGEVLVRTLRAHVSPELVRRLLGLGDSLIGVDPPELRQAVTRTARTLIENLSRG